ncbi:MAG: arylsulfatase [Phycisphaeraceae bacterium]
MSGFLVRLLLCGVAIVLMAGGNAQASDRPNVVLIMTDDQGYGDFGANGNAAMQTPRLDRLAEQSASMTDFYVSPVCSPTRASLMTGRYNYRTRVVDTWIGRSMMDPDEVTIAELLADAGYQTGIFGKWHLGDNYPMRPMDQGFAESLIHRGGGLAQPSEPRGNRRGYTDPILLHNGRKVATHGYCSDVYTDHALQFIEQAHANDEPFFVYLPYNAPHGPFHDVPEALYQQYREEAEALAELIVPNLEGEQLERQVDRLARIGAMITNVDANVGRVVDQLEKMGVAEDTLVIYLNDNGPNSRRFVGPFRGMKSEVYEGGIRSPFWLRWPRRLSPEMSSQIPAAHIDVMPTILAACGVTVPADLQLDGRNLLPLLEGEAVDWEDRPVAIQSHRGNVPQRYHHFMLRQGRWKLVNNSGFGREQLPGEPTFELYDVVADPGETRDLAEQEPQITRRLKDAYDTWFDDVSSTRPDNFAPPRIVIGDVADNPSVLTRQDWRGDGWGRNATGRWLVRADESGVYDVVVLFDAGDAAERVTLKIGEERFSREARPGVDMVRFQRVAIPQGELSIEVLLETGGTERGPHQVILHRRP